MEEEMQGRKYSIVMPVYHVEKYLEKMVSCVRNQTYSNWELILVDDCSDDQSGEICDRLSREEQRIQVIHLKQNGGLSNARNQGMKRASGEYILFLDSDDYIESTLLQCVENSLSRNLAQIVIYGLVEEYENREGMVDYEKTVSSQEKYLVSQKDIYKEIIQLEKKTLFGYAWNKAYQLSWLKENQLNFQTITMIEDVVFNVQAVKNIQSINILSDILYHYRIRDNGNLTSKYLENYFELHVQRVQLLWDLYKEWGCLNKTVKTILAGIYCRYFLSALQRNCDPRSGMTQKQKRRWIRNCFQSRLFQKLLPYLSPDNRMMKLLAIGIRRKTVWGCWIMGEIIYIIKNKCPGIFARLKQNR